VAIWPPSLSRIVVRWLSCGLLRLAGRSSKLWTEPLAASPSAPAAGSAMPAITAPASTLTPRNLAACCVGEVPPPERFFGMEAA
jgi:hypothetical protein